jgi:hypothetical protein
MKGHSGGQNESLLVRSSDPRQRDKEKGAPDDHSDSHQQVYQHGV